MAVKMADFKDTNRLLLEAVLVPVQGTRFQPTGFPNLGAATFPRSDGGEMLLVESAQSMANHLEAVCWDEQRNDLVEELTGLPYVRVLDKDGGMITNSILESHRINSPYILEGTDNSFVERLKEETAATSDSTIDIPRFARCVFKYDPNAVLHGVFIAKKEIGGGRLRLQRVLSGFIEADNVHPAESGGVKLDRVNPTGDTGKGFGHVPFHRTEFVANSIKAYFNLDLATLRAYNLGQDAEELLVNIAIWKIHQLLSSGLRLRTACDLDAKELTVTKPTGFTVPDEASLASAIRAGIEKCAERFADPLLTDVIWG
ncbi:MAG TPA: type I-U CRISPR-associated protein Cas7 [Firmicutes bacterium]|jgi:CRISPR-associated protein Csb1|nr:type I-U CRISPR-associated protein Cas7 [Bacillota bacterium]